MRVSVSSESESVSVSESESESVSVKEQLQRKERTSHWLNRLLCCARDCRKVEPQNTTN